MTTASIPTYRANLPDADTWVKRLGQIGLASKGIVYIVIGILAVMAAVGGGQAEEATTRGALRAVYAQPFGQLLLVVIGIGMLAYSLFRLVGAYKDIDAYGSDGEGEAKRAAFALSGIPYLLLGLTALGVVIGYNAGVGGGGGGGSKQQAAASLMDQRWGQWLVGLLGLGILAAGIYMIYYAFVDKFLRKVKTGGLSAKQLKTIRYTGKTGYIARGVVLGIIGVFFMQAALTHDPSEAGGLAQAFNTIARQPYGMVLLVLVALGFALYGVYSLMLARYRHFGKPRSA